MLMCIASSIVGVILFLEKRSLIGETLSHAAYPGVVLGLVISYGFEELSFLVALLFGSFTASIALVAYNRLTRLFNVKSDSALCMVLASFFGVGILFISAIQLTHGGLYKQAEGYLFGQVATMSDLHIWIYLTFACLIAGLVALLYKDLQIALFDQEFAKTTGINIGRLSSVTFLLVVFAVVIGVRSVGVVLMSAMLVAPAVAARQFVNRLSYLFFLSPLFGSVAALLGNIFSYEITKSFSSGRVSGERLVLPTGPTIVLVASALALLALLFAPNRGVVSRSLRALSFRLRCSKENLLKILWRQKEGADFKQLTSFLSLNRLIASFLIQYTKMQGWIAHEKGRYVLTSDGHHKASKIVRLHRLWEVYLVDYVGLGVKEVHASAEEMEHILTPELEKELTKLLKDPKEDPHRQPIPQLEDLP
jgi:manganese/zinc/iron transport system permease protein